MGQALGTVLPLAVGIAIFPVPIVAVVLVLRSEKGRVKALAFVLAWCVGLAAVGGGVLLLADGVDASESGEPATWVSALLLALGVLLLAAAVKQWRRRPRAGEAAHVPGWMDTVDQFTVARAGAIGFALSALNPKNVLLSVAAAAEIAAFGLDPSQQIATLAVFVALASAGVVAPLLLSLALGERSRGLLDALRDWMAANNAVIMVVLFLLIGAKLIGDAVTGFTG
ncbi:MAG TPA: GAP family protein [Gaiellaceae bacterium]|nr:GAP family protein [Gaiellaceae bacterium]